MTYKSPNFTKVVPDFSIYFQSSKTRSMYRQIKRQTRIERARSKKLMQGKDATVDNRQNGLNMNEIPKPIDPVVPSKPIMIERQDNDDA